MWIIHIELSSKISNHFIIFSSSKCINDNEQWKKNVYGGREIYKEKHGHYPNEPPHTPKKDIQKILKNIKNRNGKN